MSKMPKRTSTNPIRNSMYITNKVQTRLPNLEEDPKYADYLAQIEEDPRIDPAWQVAFDRARSYKTPNSLSLIEIIPHEDVIGLKRGVYYGIGHCPEKINEGRESKTRLFFVKEWSDNPDENEPNQCFLDELRDLIIRV